MNEAHFAEIEKALLYVSEARKRAGKASVAIAKDGAEPHLVAALDALEVELAALHRRTMQGTYFAVPAPADAQLTLRS